MIICKRGEREALPTHFPGVSAMPYTTLDGRPIAEGWHITRLVLAAGAVLPLRFRDPTGVVFITGLAGVVQVEEYGELSPLGFGDEVILNRNVAWGIRNPNSEPAQVRVQQPERSAPVWKEAAL